MKLPGRPELRLKQVICAKCNQVVDALESSGMHSSTDGLPNGEGWVMARAICHRESCDIIIPFSKLREGPEITFRVFIDGSGRFAPYGTPKMFDPERFLGVDQTQRLR